MPRKIHYAKNQLTHKVKGSFIRALALCGKARDHSGQNRYHSKTLQDVTCAACLRILAATLIRRGEIQW